MSTQGASQEEGGPECTDHWESDQGNSAQETHPLLKDTILMQDYLPNQEPCYEEDVEGL